jgi:RNA ligase (TIGR02306 family)
LVEGTKGYGVIMRKLASIRKIDAIRPIEGADAIECAVVGGWTVVVKKDEFAAGDLAVYCEIDSWIPHALAPFLSKGSEPRVYDGIAGERLRTIKLRGQLSQGLLLPFTVMNPRMNELGEHLDNAEGFDCSELLGIVKYEAPIPAQLAGEVKGMFPGWIQKTDQERIQNLKEELAYWAKEQHVWEITEKLDGSSMTVYLRDGEFGVCSRNLELKPNESNSLWKVAVANDLELKLRRAGRNIALQGELIGEGIQGNPYKIKAQDFFLFDIYNIDTNKYFTPAERKAFVDEFDIKHVPVLGTLTMDESTTIDTLLTSAEGKSVMGMIGCEREGLVFKSRDMQCSFKAISNKFLLKNKD